MPELTVMHLGLLGLLFVVGLIVGWLVRADRCAKEKIAVNASWQEQLESQQAEHNRLAEQNKSLMEQISQYQASQKDYTTRARELSDSLREAFARRDELQRQLKDARSNLEIAIAQRNRLAKERQQSPDAKSAALKEKDDKIFKLSRELTSWQSRVPPLVERFQEKSKEATALQEELDKVQTRLHALQELVRSDETHIEPVDADALPDGGAASNEPIAVTSAQDTPEIQDQIDEDAVPVDEFADPVDPESDDMVEDQEFGAVFSDDADDEENTPDADFDAVFSGSAPVETGATEAIVDDDTDDVVQSMDDAKHESDAESSSMPHRTAQLDENNDDLQMIKGIGPAIEKTLNELGIYRFHQIAEMSEFEIDRIAQQLRGFRSRIYREDWIGQARDLHYEKANYRP